MGQGSRIKIGFSSVLFTRFVWHDLWGGWDIDSVHIVGDRMIAHSHDEVRIYKRVGRLTCLQKLRGALLHLISPFTLDR